MLIKNIKYAITMNSKDKNNELGILENIDILINNKKIQNIGKNIEKSDVKEIIDGKNLIAVPSFINCHHHLYQTLLRGIGADLTLQEWLKKRKSLLNSYTPRLRYLSVILALLESIDNGVTTVFEFASNNNLESVEYTLNAVEDLSIKVILGYTPPRDNLEDISRIKDKYLKNNIIGGLYLTPLPIPPNYKDKEEVNYFKRGIELAKKHKLGVTTHLLENEKEIKTNPVEVLKECGAFENDLDLIVAHGVHCDEEHIKLLSKHNVKVVYNPLSNMRLASGVMPYPLYKKHNVLIGLGTDGSVHDSGNFFETMKAGLGLQRAYYKNTQACTINDILKMVTVDGAKILNLSKTTGSIKEGKLANINLIDVRALNISPVNDPAAQVVLNASPKNIIYVIYNGKIIKDKNGVIFKSKDKLLEEFNYLHDQVLRR